MRKTLRNIIAPLLVSAVMFTGGCNKVEKPVKEDYLNQEITFLQIQKIDSPCFRDFDKDGKIDAISDSLRIAYPLYIAEGYEKYYEDYRIKDAKIMTPEMRETASKISKGISELSYELAKEEYEGYIERKKEKEARKKK